MAPRAALVRDLVLARWRHVGRQWTLVIIAVATAIAMPVVVKAAATVTEDAALRRGIRDLDVADRILTVATYREPGETLPADLDDTARAGLADLGADDPVRVLLYRELTDNRGGLFQLAAADDLGRWVELVDGRMPTQCQPTRCEVVQLAERQPVGELRPELGIVVVGTAVRREPMLLAGTFEPRPDTSILLADGVDALDKLAALENFGRSFGWTSEVNLARIRQVGVDSWAATAVSTANRLIAAPSNLGLTAPDAALTDQVARARRSAGRFRVLAATMAVLLLAVATVGGAAVRGDHRAFVGALRRRGLSRRRVTLATVSEVVGVIFAGMATGLAVGGVAAVLLARRANLPAGDVITAAVVDQAGVLVALGAAAAVVTCFVIIIGSQPGDYRSGWPMVNGGLLLTICVGAVLVSQDDLTANASSSRGSLLPLLPVTVLSVAALATARLWPLTARGASRLIPRRRLAARLGVTGSAGRPLRSAATAAALAAALGALVFAISYQQTLQRGAADQAANAVPFDARITTGSSLERPLDVITPDVAANIDGTAWPVLRIAASIRVTAQAGEVVQMIGIDPSALPSIRRWDATVGAGTAAATADAIATVSVVDRLTIPAGRSLTIDASGPAIVDALTLVVRTTDGRVRSIPLRVEPEGGRDLSDGTQALVGDLPTVDVDSVAVIALVIAEPSDATTRRQHNLGEGRSDRSSPAHSLSLGAMSVDGTPVDTPWSAFGGATTTDGSTATVEYVMAASSVTLSTHEAGQGSSPSNPLPLAVDRRTAATAGGLGGDITLVVNQVAVHGNVATILDRFPTADGRFAVIDRAALQRIADATAPGTGQPGELWVALSHRGTTLDDTAVRRLSVTYRSALQRRFETDPIAMSASRLLLVGAVAVLILGLVVLVLVVISERTDDAATMHAWEAEGLPPSVLRSILWWRALAVALPAIPIGIGAGVLLSRLTSRLIPVTASAAAPRPPLVPGTGAWLGLLAATAALCVALAIAWIAASRSYRQATPPRVSSDPI